MGSELGELTERKTFAARDIEDEFNQEFERWNEPSMSEATIQETPAREYAHLRTKKKEREGNTEETTVVDVVVGAEVVSVTFNFEWTTDTFAIQYDLDDERELCQLEKLCETAGFEFEQVTHLEGVTVEMVYTGQRWIPSAHEAYVEKQGSAIETFRTELHLLAREIARSPRFLRNGLQFLRGMSLRQAVISVIILKKIAIVAILAVLLL